MAHDKMNALFDPIVWAILLLFLGCALIVLEVFLPSWGVLSVLAASCIFASLYVAFSQRGVTAGVSLLVVTVVFIPMAVGLAFKYLPYTPIGKILVGELPTEEEVRPEDPRRELIARVGVAQSKMLPSGAVLIDGQLVDAVSQGIAIEKGQNVVVTEVRGNRVVVRPASDNEANRSAHPDDAMSQSLDSLGLESLDEPFS